MQKIAAKLVKVMEECSFIPKNGTNSHFGYKFMQAADALGKINASLVKHGLSTVADVSLVDMRDRTTRNGVDVLATVKVSITITDSESGEQMITSGLGSGQDSGDKAVMKANTAAQKYAWVLAFQIATGDDPEADAGTDDRTHDPLDAEIDKLAKEINMSPKGMDTLRGRATKDNVLDKKKLLGMLQYIKDNPK
jgi:hypothetical protein